MAGIENGKTPERVELVKQLREQGMTWVAIGERFGRKDTTVRDWIRGHKRRTATNLGKKYRERDEPMERRTRVEQDFARLSREIPEDTRDLTARFCGDPLPGRSALDQRRV